MDFQIRILVVDDVLTTRLFMKKALKKIGFTNIVLANDGDHALIELKRGTFDLVLCDWNMPNISGLAFLQEMRKIEHLKTTPFLLITGETDKAKVIEALGAGVNQYIVKPIDVTTLEEKIKKAMKW